MIDPSAKTLAYRFVRSIPDTRAGLRLMHLMAFTRRWPGPHGATASIVQVARRDGQGAVQVELFRPKTHLGPLPILLHLHGGGYAIGAPCQDYPLFSELMAVAPCVIAAPRYRRSFQAPYPAALEDCYSTLLWLQENSREIGGDPDRIVLMGQSAGGGLVAALCLLARDRAEVRIAHQFLPSAMLDDRTDKPGMDRALWSNRKNRLCWNMYLTDPPDKRNCYGAAARAKDLSGLPPAVGFAGGCDLFHDENLAYFSRLDAAGVSTIFRTIDGGYHGVEVFAPASRAGREAKGLLLKAFQDAVATNQPLPHA